MMRRRIAAGVAVVVVIAIVLIVNAIIQSQKVSALQEYNGNVNQIARESEREISKPLFAALVDAQSKPHMNVQLQIDELRSQSDRIAARARTIGVPGEMAEAQRNLLTALDLRSEGVAKIATLIRVALAGKTKQTSKNIAGAMEVFLASDVLWSQRVKPLVGEALSSAGVSGQTSGSRFLPNLGWLSPETVVTRITGHAPGEEATLSAGTHGSALGGVSVAGVTLQPEPALNHLSGGSNPTFTVNVQNTGENPETNVKVDVAVTSGGKTVKASHSINETKPGESVNVDIPISGVTVGVAAKVSVKVEPVPGETNIENNSGVYLASFE